MIGRPLDECDDPGVRRPGIFHAHRNGRCYGDWPSDTLDGLLALAPFDGEPDR